ncbi:MAG: ROK family protein [Candidatus Tritonobacter lacicola]|nr:ROK family protein [Candidatus Tritonobacter lacicola]
MNLVGVDIGGTKIAAGLVGGKGDLMCQTRLPTLSRSGFKKSLAQIRTAIEEILKRAKSDSLSVGGIGICTAGPIDYDRGVVVNPPNLKGWKEVPLARIIGEKFGLEARLENDANAAALAEMRWGAARGYNNIFFVSIGTGIGTAIILNGRLYRGRRGMAGEGGHMVVNFDADGAGCGCGNTGCIESIASGPAAARRAGEIMRERPTLLNDLCGGNKEELTMVMIGRAAEDSDAVALEVIGEMGWHLGIWLGSIINLLDPEIIVVGGGVSMVGEPLFESIRGSALKHTINPYANEIPIVPASLGEDAGIYGGAALFLT